MAYASEVGLGIERITLQLADDFAWPSTWRDQVLDLIEAAELATFGEYEVYESASDQAEVYQLVRDGVKALPSRPAEGVQELIDWLNSSGKLSEYEGGAGSWVGSVASGVMDSGEAVSEAPEKIGKLGGGLGALAAGLALLLFVFKR
jgi:hypothetical protein